MTDEGKKNWFLWIVVILCLAVIAVSFYQFFFKKNYEFIVEIACDPKVEECFTRDCSEPDLCPLNNLTEFKRYSLNANDFKSCENEDCAKACTEGQIECVQLECVEDPESGEYCISPDSIEDTEESQIEEVGTDTETTEEAQ